MQAQVRVWLRGDKVELGWWTRFVGRQLFDEHLLLITLIAATIDGVVRLEIEIGSGRFWTNIGPTASANWLLGYAEEQISVDYCIVSDLTAWNRAPQIEIVGALLIEADVVVVAAAFG